MNFKEPLISGVFIKRYKRFFVDIKIGNKTVVAHCPNTGSMMGLLKEGNQVWLSKSDNPMRKLKYTLQIIEDENSKIGVNTHLTNKIVLYALNNKKIESFKNVKYIKQEEIENIYATSAGAIIGVYICLNLNWETLIEYITNKPWTKKYETKPSTFFSAFDEKGIFGNEFVKDILEVQFKMKGLKTTITLKEFYEYSKINLKMYSFNLNKFESECLNHETYPELSVLDAVYMSSTFPFIFKPLYYNNNMYVDGGLKNEYPLNRCIEDNHELDTIFGIKIIDTTKYEIKPDDNIISLLYYFIRRFIINNRDYYEKDFTNEIVIKTSKSTDPSFTNKILSSKG